MKEQMYIGGFFRDVYGNELTPGHYHAVTKETGKVRAMNDDVGEMYEVDDREWWQCFRGFAAWAGAKAKAEAILDCIGALTDSSTAVLNVWNVDTQRSEIRMKLDGQDFMVGPPEDMVKILYTQLGKMFS